MASAAHGISPIQAIGQRLVQLYSVAEGVSFLEAFLKVLKENENPDNFHLNRILGIEQLEKVAIRLAGCTNYQQVEELHLEQARVLESYRTAQGPMMMNTAKIAEWLIKMFGTTRQRFLVETEPSDPALCPQPVRTAELINGAPPVRPLVIWNPPLPERANTMALFRVQLAAKAKSNPAAAELTALLNQVDDIDTAETLADQFTRAELAAELAKLKVK
jgi:hypothetical protein